MKDIPTAINDKAKDADYPDVAVALRDMKQDDLQQIIGFLFNEVSALTARVDNLEKEKDGIIDQ